MWSPRNWASEQPLGTIVAPRLIAVICIVNATPSRRALSRARRLVFETPRPAKRAPGARSLRVRPVVSRRYPPRSNSSPLNYTDPSGFSAEASRNGAVAAGIGVVGVPIVDVLLKYPERRPRSSRARELSATWRG